MGDTPNVSNSLTIRVQFKNDNGMLGRLASEVGRLGGDIGAVDLVSVGNGLMVRDLTINCRDDEHAAALIAGIRALDDFTLLHSSDRTFLLHLGGKIEVVSRVPIRTRDDLSMVYTPGVARVCMAIHARPEDAYSLTIKKNTVAVITDGTAVLGLGNIGPAAAMPVMEGKCALFKEFAGVDAFPLAINTTDTDGIVETVSHLATAFGGINLEDIAAPRCFEIEKRLRARLDIPVFHDDQHGTAIVTLAPLINALRLVNKNPDDLKVVFSGVGAAGVTVSKIFMDYGVTNLIGCDRRGAVYRGRTENMNFMKQWYADHTNPNDERGSLAEVIEGADVFVGLSAPGVLTVPIRHGESNTGDHAGGSGATRSDHGDRAFGLSQPDQQRARVPWRVPRRPRCTRHDHQRRDEAGGGPRHRGGHPDRRAARGLHHPERLQQGSRQSSRAGRGNCGPRERCGPPLKKGMT